jgi:hypothetical protein
VRDLDRFARCEPARQAGLLQELADVDVRLWEYQSKEFVRLDGANFIVTSARMISAEQEKLKASTRIREALHLRAEQGYAVGRSIFGFDHRRDGRIVHRVRNEAEIATILHVGETAVRLGSFNGAATALNAEGVRAPAGGSWDARAVKALLIQPIYRGQIVYGRTRSVSKRGTNLRVPAAEEAVQRHARPELAIWPADLRRKVDALIVGRTRNHSPRARRTHLASGFVKCGLCGTGVVSSGSLTSGSGCVTYCCDKMRAHRCPGIGYRNERAVDDAVMAALAPLVSEDVVQRACLIAREHLQAEQHEETRASEIERIRRELAVADRRCRNVGDAIAEADAAQRPDLMARHRDEVQRREALKDALAEAERAIPRVDSHTLVDRLEVRATELRGLLALGGAEARVAIEAILGPARFVATPATVEGRKRWDLRLRIGGGYLFAATGAALPRLCAPQKAPVKEVRAFDRDGFHVHNAYRSPGRLDEGELGKTKAEVYQARYENFRWGLSAQPKFIDASSEADLEGVTFAFVCVDKGPSRAGIFDLLLSKRIPFIDVGMGLNRKRGPLSGMLRVTYYSAERGAEVRAQKRATEVEEPDDEYRTSIQLSELNAINAGLAVLKYKQLRGFYVDDRALYHLLLSVEDPHLVGDSFQ